MGAWEKLRARSGKLVPGRWTNPGLLRANEAYADACHDAVTAASLTRILDAVHFD
jgi:hypothetical protein